MPNPAETVVDRFNKIVSEEGGSVQIVSMSDDTLNLRYKPGKSDCEACVMLPDDLRDLIHEALERQMPSITKVELETVEV